MDISVLLATCRRDEALRPMLESLSHGATEGLSWEVVVVDNADNYLTRDLVDGFRTSLSIKYIVERTPGKNNALNTGLAELNGDLIVLTDDDVIAPESWLREMWAGACRWPGHSVFAGRVLPKWPSLGATPPVPITDPLVQGAYAIADWPGPEGPTPAIRVLGANMAVRAAVFKSGWRFNSGIGPKGLDYVMGSESEFTARLEKAGLGAIYLPSSTVWHQIRAEQLRAGWLYERCFRSGRGLAVHANCFPEAPRLFGVPRFLWRKLAETVLKRLSALLQADREARVRYGMQYWRWRGYLHQCRVGSRYPMVGP
jgi:glycosyltransferase involved in cell wall biosynthesis